MCLISVLGKGTTKYSEEVTGFLKRGMDSNGDGSGFMYKRDGGNTVVVRKGFFKFDELMAALNSAELKDSDELVVHHRIGTSGLVSAENTHPFIISHVHDTIVQTDAKVNLPCLVHNGMFSELEKHERINPNFSDTYAFARYIMTNAIDLYTLETDLFKKALRPVIGGSKICVVYPHRDLIMLGDFVEDNGYFHSHRGYKPFSTYVDRGGSELPENFIVGTTTRTPIIQIGCSTNLQNCSIAKRTTKDVLQLDGNKIDINEFNYSHFVFTIKNSSSERVWKFESYDSEAEINILSCQRENYLSTHTTRTDELHSDYHFHPRRIYKEYYEEYAMVVQQLQPTKSLFKTISKLLQDNRLALISRKFKIKGLNISKCTLMNYYLSLNKQYLTAHSCYCNIPVNSLTSPFVCDLENPYITEIVTPIVTPFISDKPELIALEDVRS